MKFTVIVDLDGTLSLADHRRYLVRKAKEPKWNEFFLAAEFDPPNIPVIKTVQALHKSGNDIHILSGRGRIAEQITIDWLMKHNVPYKTLTMRNIGDSTPDEELKESWLHKKFPNYLKDVLLVIDDRKKVVEMWRSKGLTCLQVAEGNF